MGVAFDFWISLLQKVTVAGVWAFRRLTMVIGAWLHIGDYKFSDIDESVVGLAASRLLFAANGRLCLFK